MRIGVFSRYPVRLCWYSSIFPAHSFLHIVPESAEPDGEEFDSYIVDADLLTEDREAYGDLTRYFNRNIIDALDYQEQSLCLPRSEERQCDLKSIISIVRDGPSGSRFHTIIHQEKRGL